MAYRPGIRVREDDDDFLTLNEDNFEYYVGTCCTQEDMLRIFNVTHGEMDAWCYEHYKMDYNTSYWRMCLVIKERYKSVMAELASRGNASAINTINQFLLGMENKGSAVVVIDASVPDIKKD